MDEKLKKKWIKALRSGEYKQTHEALWGDYHFTGKRDSWGTFETVEGKGHCCLGVLCDIQGFEPTVDGRYMVPVDWSILPDGHLRDVVEDDMYVKDGKPHILAEGELPSEVRNQYGLNKRVQHEGKPMDLQTKLMSMNDSGKSFEDIADYLEKVKF